MFINTNVIRHKIRQESIHLIPAAFACIILEAKTPSQEYFSQTYHTAVGHLKSII